ncbi:Protein of unknown function [Virgibacillus subterraneus]|uniref:DUF2487 domain-containing protein n=3 Tax=Bacillaceae TaxID=186817 RepID=A0A1H1BS16_9BACI|nr:Protein of unknown function [Virgibacillus salinus]SEQ26081.1 Protein of unknown function [Virgibacillus subterraneus]
MYTMKWKKSDLHQYVNAKEYVDTIIIPLIPFQLSNDSVLEKDAFQREVLVAFSYELEKELTGRVLLTPNYNYLKSSHKDQEIVRINSWIDDIEQQPFNHIFYVTFDSTWKKNEQGMRGTLLWLPGVSDGTLQSNEMHSIIRSNVEQVSELIRSYWKD